LEPLSGYLVLAADLSTDSTLSGEAFNFGPPADHNYSVSELLEQMQQHWPGTEWQDTSKPSDVYEASLLKLCCDKALHRLSWRPLLAFSENIEMTASWYTTYYSGGTEMWKVTQKQIQDYENLGSDRGAPWGK
jgi:CDP-glucose 4,6-dehydratase